MTSLSYKLIHRPFYSSLRYSPILRTRVLLTFIYVVTAPLVIIFVQGYFIDFVLEYRKYFLVSENNLMFVELTAAFLLAPLAFYISGIALKRLGQIYESQKLFMSNASHELKGPINLMRLNSEIALLDIEQHKCPEEVTEMVKKNILELERMSEMIETLRKLASRTFGNDGLVMQMINLGDVARNMAGTIELQYREKRHKYEITADANTDINGNKTALEEMIYNLLKNAAIYTPDGGLISIKVYNSEGNVRLVIQDTGPGISKEDLPHIFEAFYRAKTLGRPAGTGLGLAIVNEIARNHNASIKVDSEIGKGTLITADFKAA